jgi:arylsulfatase
MRSHLTVMVVVSAGVVGLFAVGFQLRPPNSVQPLVGGPTAKPAEPVAEPAPAKLPNVVFILADNLGYGELGCYGGGVLRGAATPRIDRLAAEGARLLNFNVEPNCTPSRSALLTGRFPIRSGTYNVPRDGLPYGLVQWEVTTAELLAGRGYATGAFGKWHLGDSPGRYPTDQGFDEWYGIPNSADECLWVDAKPGRVMEGRRGQEPRPVRKLDLDARREIDLELTAKAIDFMKRAVKAGKPFLAYVPLTQPHYPTVPSKQFVGKTGNGDWADVLAQMDWCVGQLLDAVDELRVADDTVFIFASDNGPEDVSPWRGWAGPWSGSYVTAMEGSIRVPFVVRWPGKVPAERVSNEIVHAVDVFTTLATLCGAAVPADRPIDGVDLTPFLLGRRNGSGREGFPIYRAEDLYAVKWRNWKVHYYWKERMDSAPERLDIPRTFNLYVSPQERADEGLNTTMQNRWVLAAVQKHLAPFRESLRKYPPIPTGAPDSYVPPRSAK